MRLVCGVFTLIQARRQVCQRWSRSTVSLLCLARHLVCLWCPPRPWCLGVVNIARINWSFCMFHFIFPDVGKEGRLRTDAIAEGGEGRERGQRGKGGPGRGLRDTARTCIVKSPLFQPQPRTPLKWTHFVSRVRPSTICTCQNLFGSGSLLHSRFPHLNTDICLVYHTFILSRPRLQLNRAPAKICISKCTAKHIFSVCVCKCGSWDHQGISVTRTSLCLSSWKSRRL